MAEIKIKIKIITLKLDKLFLATSVEKKIDINTFYFKKLISFHFILSFVF